jgi:chemotaxis protein MotB
VDNWVLAKEAGMFAFRFILTIYVGALFFFTGATQASSTTPLDAGIETTTTSGGAADVTQTVRNEDDWASAYTSGQKLNRTQVARLVGLLKELTADFDYNSADFLNDPKNFGLTLPFLLNFKIKELEFVLSNLADGGLLKNELDKGLDSDGYNKIKAEIAKSAEERIRAISNELEEVRKAANDSKTRLEGLKAQGIDENSEVYVTTIRSIEAYEREIAYQLATIELHKKFSRPGLETVANEMKGGFLGIGADKSYEALVAEIRRVMRLVEGNTTPMGPKPNLASEILKRLDQVRAKASEKGGSAAAVSRYEAAYIVSWFFSRDNFTQAIEILKKKGDGTGDATTTTTTTDTNVTAASGVALWNNISRLISQPGGDAFKVRWPEGGAEVYSVADKNIHNVMQFGNSKKVQVTSSVNISNSATRAAVLDKIAADYPAYQERVNEYKAIAHKMKALLDQRDSIVANLNRLLSSVGMSSFEELNPQTDAQVVQLLDQFVEKVASRGDEAQSLSRELVKGIKDYAAVNVQIIGLFLHGESILVKMQEDLANEETDEDKQKKERINRLVKWIQDFDARRVGMSDDELKAIDDFGVNLEKTYGKAVFSMLTFVKSDHSSKLDPMKTAVFSAGFSECATLFPQDYNSFDFAGSFSEYNTSVTTALTTPAEKKLVCLASYEWIRKENLKSGREEFIFDNGEKPFDLKVSSIIDSMGDKADQVKDAENFNWSLYEGFHELLYLMGKFQDLVIKVIEKRFKDEGVDLSRANIGVERSEQDSGVAFRLPDSILFEMSHFVIKDNGKTMMKKNIPILLKVLCEFKDIIQDLSIDGHSCPSGGTKNFPIYSQPDKKGKIEGNNQMLSEKRAEAVFNYCNSGEMNIPKLADFRAQTGINIVHAGHAYKYPIKNENGSVNNAASRRVEFKFRLKVSKIAEIRKNPAELQRWRHRINEILAGRPDPFPTNCNFGNGTPADDGEVSEEPTVPVTQVIETDPEPLPVVEEDEVPHDPNDQNDPGTGEGDEVNPRFYRNQPRVSKLATFQSGWTTLTSWNFRENQADGKPLEADRISGYIVQQKGNQRFVRVFVSQRAWYRRKKGLYFNYNGNPAAMFHSHKTTIMKELAKNPWKYYRTIPGTARVSTTDPAMVNAASGVADSDIAPDNKPRVKGVTAVFHHLGGSHTYDTWGISMGGIYNVTLGSEKPVAAGDDSGETVVTPPEEEEEVEEEEVEEVEEPETTPADFDDRGGLVLPGISIRSEHKNGNQGTENICSDYVVQQRDNGDVRYVRLKISKDLWARKLREANGDALKLRRDYEPIMESLAVNPWRFYPGQHMMAPVEIQSRSWQEPFESWNQAQTEVIIAAEFRMRSRDFDQTGPRLTESAAIAEVRKWISYLEVLGWPQFDNEVYQHGKLFNRNIVIIRDGNAQYLRDFYNELKKSDSAKAGRLWSEHLNPMIEEDDGKYVGSELSTKRGSEYHNQLKDRLFALYKFLSGQDFPSRSVSPANEIQQWLDYLEKAGWPERGMNHIYSASGLMTIEHRLVAVKAQFLNTTYENLKKTDAAKAERLQNDHLSKILKTMNPIFGSPTVIGALVKAKHNGQYHNVLRDHLLGVYRLLAGKDYNLE